MLSEIAKWIWDFKNHCPETYNPDPHWGLILRAWRWGVEPKVAAQYLTEGRVDDLARLTQ
ncbi:hypothetical protein EDE05_102108 [Neorhizobium sp. R1-B]|jgi:hypothetical protein|nr:hypothetical protein EDE05_102108 [Neorhizobium sp. R1-B]